MSYDFDGAEDRSPPDWLLARCRPAHPTDLEAILQLLELAAIELTPERGSEFTFDELLATAQKYGGSEVVLDPKDVAIVIDMRPPFLERRPGKRFRLK